MAVFANCDKMNAIELCWVRQLIRLAASQHRAAAAAAALHAAVGLGNCVSQTLRMVLFSFSLLPANQDARIPQSPLLGRPRSPTPLSSPAIQ